MVPRSKTRDDHERTALLLAATARSRRRCPLLSPMVPTRMPSDDRHDHAVARHWCNRQRGDARGTAAGQARLHHSQTASVVSRSSGQPSWPRRLRCAAWCRPTSTSNHVNDPGWTALLEAVILGDGRRAVAADRADPARRRRRSDHCRQTTVSPRWNSPAPRATTRFVRILTRRSRSIASTDDGVSRTN